MGVIENAAEELGFRVDNKGTHGSLWQPTGTLNNKRRIVTWNRPFKLTSTVLKGTRLPARAISGNLSTRTHNQIFWESFCLFSRP